jgi:hypothetical protein
MSNEANAVKTVVTPGCEIIHVPNKLAAKVGPNFKLSGAAAIAKAEKAMVELASNFGEWLEQEVAALEEARGELKAAGLTSEMANRLSVRALDLKGLGVTYEHPLVTRIGASLFKLLDEIPLDKIPMNLIDAHVDAIRAIVRNQIRDTAHPVGDALVKELELRVRELTLKVA